jgi:tRNA nucleotidyltransferase/poly(A) polymerase
MNALFCSPDGALYDPFGGLADLRAGRVRFVGEARERIREDVLRLLRFFRFYAHYGRPPPDPEALAAARQLAPLLPTLSGERVCGETFKLLRAPDPAPVFELMAGEGVLATSCPGRAGLARSRRAGRDRGDRRRARCAAPARRPARRRPRERCGGGQRCGCAAVEPAARRC